MKFDDRFYYVINVGKSIFTPKEGDSVVKVVRNPKFGSVFIKSLDNLIHSYKLN